MDLELTSKTAIITGGSRGIGKAVGREFGLEGMSVALVARGQEALEETARELAEETGANFITILADTGDPESVKAMVKEAAERLGRIDILVNSARPVWWRVHSEIGRDHRRRLLERYEHQGDGIPAVCPSSCPLHD